MHDVVYVAVIIGFFVVAAAYIRGCSRILGREAVAPVEADHEQ
jgi:hypothetical protein